MAVDLGSDNAARGQQRANGEQGADRSSRAQEGAARSESVHSTAAMARQDAASARSQAVQQVQTQQREVAALEAARPRPELRAELRTALSGARQQLTLSQADAARSMKAELTLAQQTLSPSMAERYVQDVFIEYRNDPDVQAQLHDVQVEIDASPVDRAWGVCSMLDMQNTFGGPALAQAPLSPQAPKSVSSDELERMADAVASESLALDKGTALAGALQGLEGADQAKLVGLVLSRQSGGAHMLTAETLGQLHDECQISSAEYAAIANGFVGAANAGLLSQDGGAAVDHFLQTYTDPSGASMDAAVALITAAQGPQAQKFLRDHGRAAFSVMADGPYAGSNAAEAVVQLLSRTTDTKTIAEIYAGFDEQQRHNILESLSTSDKGRFGADGRTSGADSLAILIDAVGSQKGWAQTGAPVDLRWQSIPPSGPAYDRLAVEIAKFAETSDDRAFFDGIKPRDARAEALGVLFTNHSKGILDEFTNVDVPNLRGALGSLDEIQIEKVQLANLLRLTALNPDNGHAADAEVEVTNYLDHWVAMVGNEDASKVEANARLGSLTRAQILVPVQIYLHGIELKQTEVKLYKFAVDGMFKMLKRVSGAGALGGRAIELLADATKAAIDDKLWEGKAPFIESLANNLDAFRSTDAGFDTFSVEREVRGEIANVLNFAGKNTADAYKAFLHSKDAIALQQ
jgi:hypothetical protein